MKGAERFGYGFDGMSIDVGLRIDRHDTPDVAMRLKDSECSQGSILPVFK
jgi:hypothetical protein